MKKYYLCLWMLAFAFSCKKKEKLQESTWIANGETFTAVAKKSTGKATAGISSDNIHNRFLISFSFPYLPTSDTWQSSYPNLGNLIINFYYSDSFYVSSTFQNAKITASLYNNTKAHYTLPPTWFINYYNNTDSVLISGDFYEP